MKAIILAREIITVPTGETITLLTGADAEAAALALARECAARGGRIATEFVAEKERDSKCQTLTK